MAARVTYPWKLSIGSPEGPIEKKHRSEPSVYREVNSIREDVVAGTRSPVTVTVWEWDKGGGRWQLFERLSLTQEGE